MNWEPYSSDRTHGICFDFQRLKVFIIHPKRRHMSIVKVIEVIASSEKSIDDALQNAVREVSKTVHNIDSVFVKDIKVHVKDGKITTYGLICKVAFRLDEKR